MLDERKSAILRAIVEEYIQTAQPVGSHHVLETTEVSVSAATIRNEMVALEREGFLQQPHTSAGRVPTEKGYRFFVDQLSHPGLGVREQLTVRSFFETTHLRLEQLLADTSRLLADLTSYAGVVVGTPHEAESVRSVQLVPLGPLVALAVVVLSSGAIERRVIDIDAEVTEDQLHDAGLKLSEALVGTTLTAGVGAPVTGDPTVDRLLVQVCDSLSQPEPQDSAVFVGGASKMASAFDALETVRSVLSVLEEQYVVVSLLRDVLDRGLSVAIGRETGVEPLADCALVVAPYEVDGHLAGTIGVLGPTRMNYPQALAAVAVVSGRLGDHLSRG